MNDNEMFELSRRASTDIGRISRRRQVMGNEWVVAGTRIPVWMIQSLYESGSSVDEIVAEYPMLSAADVRAALAFELPPAAKHRG